MLELSQVTYSFYYYDIEGYRHCLFCSGQSVNKNKTLENETLAKNQLLFIKLLLYKIDVTPWIALTTPIACAISGS